MVKHASGLDETSSPSARPSRSQESPKFQANVNVNVTAIRNNYMITTSKPLSQAVGSQKPPQVQSPIHGQGMCTGQSDQSQNSKSLPRIQNLCVTNIDASLLNLAH